MLNLGARANRWLAQIAMTLFAFAMSVPLIWMLETSFKPEGEVMSATPHWIPAHPTLDNYKSLFSSEHVEEFPVVRWFLNSVAISLAATFLVLVVASSAAYAFARLKFRGREALFLVVLATMMVPGQVMVIPVFLIVQKLGMFNSYPGIVLPGLGGAFGVFLLRQFFLQLPIELEEAAYIDGAGYFTVFRRIILPLSKPALATLAIFTFMASWNDFVWPLIITDDVSMRTLPVGLTIFQGRYTLEYGLTMAAAAITTAPMIVAFLFFQKRITEGIALQGLKG
jgi:multiple sugar transport system permease protein